MEIKQENFLSNFFEMSPEVKELRQKVREFIDTEVIPIEMELLESRGTPGKEKLLKDVQEKAKKQGLWALGIPKEAGGGGLPFLDYCYINEIIGRSEAARIALGTHQTQDAIMLHYYGTAEQKERYLKPLVNGDIYPSVGFTEPNVAGSDPTLIQTTAILDGDEWVINGHKWFTSSASIAAFTTVFAITDPDAPRHRRASMIIVPTDTPGYEIVREVKTMGHRLGRHCEVRYNNVRVPKENLLGKRGEGFIIGQRRLGPGRIFHCMRWLGQMQRAFDLMCERALSRYAHGSYLADKQFIQKFIYDSVADIQTARFLTLHAAHKLDQGEARIDVSLIKAYGAKALHRVIDRAIQVFGAKGLTEDTPLEFMYREARYARVYDGPDEVHMERVAKNILKMYRDGGYWDPTDYQ